MNLLAKEQLGRNSSALQLHRVTVDKQHSDVKDQVYPGLSVPDTG